jgi:hypothetical protein
MLACTTATIPAPERAKRAIWGGRMARRREAPSTGRGGAPSLATLDDHFAYIHVDTLGSVDVLFNSHGGEAERRSYDPFGAHRDPDDWTKPLPTPPVAAEAEAVAARVAQTLNGVGHAVERSCWI